ncbi:MAG: CopG family ribbon-helix-helix protein [Candidatus Micrarchaeota archaeon]
MAVNNRGKTVEIVSVSMEPGLLRSLDSLCTRLGYRSRSKLVRMAVRALDSEYAQVESLRGRRAAVLVARHSKAREARVTDITHEFHDIVTSTMHCQGDADCSEVIVVEGDAGRITELYRRLKAKKGVKGVLVSVM